MSATLRSFRSRFINVENTDELKAVVSDILPFNENEFKISNIQGSVKKFKAVVECTISSEEEFVKSYQSNTNETLRKLTPRYTGEKSLYKQFTYFRCHHNTRYQATMNSKMKMKCNPSQRFKNTDCPFSLVLKYKKEEGDNNCLLEMEWTHNHPVNSLQSLSFKDIKPDVVAEITQLYERGFTPGLAYREIWTKTKKSYESEVAFHKFISDRSVFPRRTDYNYLYTEYHRKKYGTQNTSTMFEKLNTLVEQETLKDSDISIKAQKFDAEQNDPFILVIITPLMKRVHEKIRSSGELVFLDSSGGMEEYNLRVFLMVTHSFVGALPLGIIVTSDETTDTITRALEIFSATLPDVAFYDKGPLNGPGVIMTDNCDELKDALHAVWPKSRLLLCIFHLMQQVWRWLFDKKHGISQHDRPVIMAKFRKVVYAELETEMEEVYDELLDSFGPKYPQLTSYLENVYDMRERWCLCYRRKMTIRGNNTNNFVEAQFLVLKDNILNRTKEININGLFEKLTKDFNDHYKSKLLSVANGRFDGIYSRRFMGKTKEKGEGVGYKLPPEPVLREVAENIISNGSNIYLVPSFTDPSVHYCVDMELGLCECDVGSDGSPCKHQYVTWRQHLKSANFIPYLSSEERKQCSYIAIGESLPDVYYEGLRDYLDAGTNVTESSGQSVHSDSESHDTIQQDPMDEGSTSNVTDERRSVETVNFQEIQTEFTEASEKILRMIELNRNNNDFLRGVSKFCDRISKYETQTSKLCSAFHTFASDIHYSKKVTNQTHSKSRTGKKIKVQPEAVKRRSTISGSKVAIQKGMTKRKNPFNVEPSLKRGHSFTKNVSNNEPVAKKAGRTMGSKTKFLTPQVKRPAIKKDSKQ